jgi:hypothetical protein
MRIESVFQNFRYLRNVKRCKTCVSGLNALFWAPKLQIWFRNQNIHSTPLDPKWLFGVFWSISETLRAWLHYLLPPKLQRSFRNQTMHSTPMDPKSLIAFRSISETFRMKKICKAPKMMIGTFLEHCANLRNVKRCEICVSGLNALFRGIEVAMHSWYFIRSKMIFGCVLDHFANHRT